MFPARGLLVHCSFTDKWAALRSPVRRKKIQWTQGGNKACVSCQGATSSLLLFRQMNSTEKSNKKGKNSKRKKNISFRCVFFLGFFLLGKSMKENISEIWELFCENILYFSFNISLENRDRICRFFRWKMVSFYVDGKSMKNMKIFFNGV